MSSCAAQLFQDPTDDAAEENKPQEDPGNLDFTAGFPQYRRIPKVGNPLA